MPVTRFLSVALLAALLGFRPGALRAQPPAPAKVTLQNGVRLILKPEADTEFAALVAFIRAPRPASPGEEAVGALVARALFSGSANRSGERVALALGAAGGRLDMLRTPDYIAVTLTTVPARLREAIYLLCEALKNADFTPEALAAAREEIERERAEQDADDFARGRALMGGHALPEASRLRRVTPEQAQDYFRRRYAPERVTVALAGSFDAAFARRAFANDLADFERALRAPLPTPQEVPFSPQNHILPASGQTASAFIATAAPTVASPDYPAFAVLHALLGGGNSARLFREIREKRGAGYEVGALYAAERGEPLIAYLQWQPGRFPAPDAPAAPPPLPAPPRQQAGSRSGNPEGRGIAAEALLQQQVDSLLAAPPGDDEIERARSLAIGRYALRHERARDRAFLLGWYECLGLGADFDAELPRLLASVTREDVLRVAQKYLPSRASVLILPQRK